MLELFIFVIGHSRSPFSVEIEGSKTVDNLKRIIAREKAYLSGVDIENLTLYRVEIKDSSNIGQVVPRDGEILQPFCVLSDVFPSKPPRAVNILIKVGRTQDTVEDEQIAPTELALRRYDKMFIKAKKRGEYVEWEEVGDNKIHPREHGPDFVSDFEEMLDSKPGLSPDDRDWVMRYLGQHACDQYFASQSMDHQQRRNAGRLEVRHIANIEPSEWENIWYQPCGMPFKADLANALFFFNMLLFEKDETITLGVDPSFPFHLVVECQVEGRDAYLYRYTPRPDFLISKFNLPRLLVAVNSERSRLLADLVWVLLQGAAIVRFANAFLDTFKEKRNFALCTIYISDDGTASRYTMFQELGDEVFYTEKRFRLHDPVNRIQFARQFYNLLHNLGDEESNDTRERTRELAQAVESKVMETFHTTKGSWGTKRRRTDDSDSADETDRGTTDGTNYAELRAHGFEVKSDVFTDDSGNTFEPLFEMPAHILTVYRPSDPEEELIAKKVRKKSNELQLLEFLNVAQPRSEHIISLLYSLSGKATQWAILPKMNSLAFCVAFPSKRFEDKIIQICFGLIKGLAYLHELCIAHRDIKPDNLVVDTNFCLKIIDFDVAVRIEDEDEKVDDQHGTTYWIAPEVKRRLSHSPIKADRWSCGCVLLYLVDTFRKGDTSLREFAKKLKAHDPNQRPSLVGWRSFFSLLASAVGNVSDAEERRTSGPRKHPTTGVDKEPPCAKKVKVDGSGQGCALVSSLGVGPV